MRTLVDIPDSLLIRLTEVSQQKKISRSELIRQLIRDFLSQNSQQPAKNDYFGLWHKKEDGLAYQQKMREQW